MHQTHHIDEKLSKVYITKVTQLYGDDVYVRSVEFEIFKTEQQSQVAFTRKRYYIHNIYCI